MPKSILSVLFCCCTLMLMGQNSKWVNPFIGTGGHGHTYPGATLPFGMVQLSPDTRIDGSWDGCSGYHYSDTKIYGFSHTHLSGTGVSDYGDILIMPTLGKPMLTSEGYASTFSHDKEWAQAAYYKVFLDNPQVTAELTASTRVGFHQYTFNKSGEAHLVLDLNHRDELLEGIVRILDDRTIEIYRNSSAWATNQKLYARLEFDRPMKLAQVQNEKTDRIDLKEYSGKKLAMSFSTQVKSGDKIKVKVALSPTGFKGAQLNATEIPHWDFDRAKKEGQLAWDAQLSKIEIPTDNPVEATKFYTALYHCFIQPNIAQDIDGQYRGRDDQIHKAEGFDYYSVFSLWDTFRAAHPLYTLLERKRTADFINTFIAQYEQGGRLPVWELASNETDCMIGYHSVSVIADAMAKKIPGFDYEKAFRASVHSARLDHLGLEAYKKNGFISIDDEHESVSKTLEYAYDDFCIAQMAKILGHTAEYEEFMERSQNWIHVFDWENKFMRAKRNGGWDTPFDPREVNNNYTEGNSWQYSFFVPHDIEGMITYYGGDREFEQKLDELFNTSSQTTGREQVDITGLIGQYAHGNEPSHHMAHYYFLLGQHEKGREKIGYILREFYTDQPDGLIGNEDCGQMSAWYVLNTLGVYPFCPGRPEWISFRPFVENATIHLEDGTQRKLHHLDKMDASAYFGFEELAGIPHQDHFSLQFPVPVIEAKDKSFKNSQRITLKSMYDVPIFYAVSPSKEFKKYNGPFEIDRSCTIQAYSEHQSQRSKTVSAQFFVRDNDYRIELKHPFHPQYHAGGPEGLIDYIKGNHNWRKGDWQGYQGSDFEVIVDLNKTQKVSRLSANFLQDTRSWIVFPTAVEFYISRNGIDFTHLGTVTNTIDIKDYEIQTQEFEVRAKEKARYVKVVAKNYGKLPDWHQGAQGDAFIFVDEIEIEK